MLQDAQSVATNMKSRWRTNDIIIDWKDSTEHSISFLDKFLQEMNKMSINSFLKVPASYLCKDMNGKPLILGLASAKKIIVEMYGE